MTARKRGRPTEHDEPTVNTTVRLPRSLYERLWDEAHDRDVSLSKIIEWSLTRGVEQLTPIDSVLTRDSDR